MTATSTLRFAGACAALAISLTCTAQAANTRSWVSRNGNDVMDCSLAHPCRTFQHAYDVTEAYGEIDVLEAGDYGPVTINHSIVIDGANLAHIYTNSGPVIKVGATAHTVIRNLAIDGDQYAAQAILWNGTGTLYLQNVNITGVGGLFMDSLSAFGPSPSTRRLYLEDVKMHNCVYGVEVFSTPGLLVPVMVSIKNSTFQGGLNLGGTTGLSFGQGRVIVTNSVVSGYDNAILAYGSADVEVTGSSILGSGVGVAVQGSNSDRSSTAVVRLANDDVAGNVTAFSSGVGQILSFGNNRVAGNSSHGSPTAPVAVE